MTGLEVGSSAANKIGTYSSMNVFLPGLLFYM